MFTKIMVPVDLTHIDRLERALSVARDLAMHWGASITYVGATGPQPGPVAHNPAEYARKLSEFAANVASNAGVATDSHAITLHDPAIDLDDALVEAAKQIGADLVVMASHIPGLQDHLWPSHGGRLASHSAVSVLVVRPQ